MALAEAAEAQLQASWAIYGSCSKKRIASPVCKKAVFGQSCRSLLELTENCPSTQGGPPLGALPAS